jgi:predicted dinucleotide-binding enzyme
MRIGILGTGMVGRTLAGRLSELGHELRIGTRDPDETLSRGVDARGNPSLRDWLDEHPGVALATFAEAAAHAEVVINATSGIRSLEALRRVDAGDLDGKVLLDLANALDSSRGMPPALGVSEGDSLAEQIQREFPAARVVKSLNTMSAPVMVHPEYVGGGDHTVFISGNDAAAKSTVTELLRAFGHTDVIDLGDITTARGPEMYMSLWLRLWAPLGTPMFNVKVVR